MKHQLIILFCCLSLIAFSQEKITSDTEITISVADTNLLDFGEVTSYMTLWDDCTPSRGNLLTLGIIDLSIDDYSIPIGDGLAMRGDKVAIDTAYLLSMGWILPEPKVVKINQSGSGLWGIKMLAPFLIINQLDTIPAIDSVTYEKINGDFYKREYTSEYAIFYTMPEDSTSLDADSVAFDLILDSLYREFDVADRRINRLKDRIDLEQENKRELRNAIKDATIRQRELLRIRRRYYRQL